MNTNLTTNTTETKVEPNTQMFLEKFSEQTIPDLVHHITERYHGWLRNSVPSIIIEVKSAGVAMIGARVELNVLYEKLEFLWDELENHLWKEEQILFPRLANTEFTSEVMGPISVLSTDHQDHERALTDIESLLKQILIQTKHSDEAVVLVAIVGRLISELREHILLENSVLFSKVSSFFEGQSAKSCCGCCCG